MSEGDNNRISTLGAPHTSCNAPTASAGARILEASAGLTDERKSSSITTSKGDENPVRKTGKRSGATRRAARAKHHASCNLG